MTNDQIASRVKVENPPKWHAIYWIKEVMDSDAMDTWIERAHIDHLIIVHPKTWDTMLNENEVIPLFIFEYLTQKKHVTSTKHWKRYVCSSTPKLMVWV